MHIQTDRGLVPASTTSVRYLHITVCAPPASASTDTPRPPAEVALVLDRSGSMGGAKIAMARTAVQHAVRLMKPQDHLAVVAYDDHVDTVLARTAASANAKAQALSSLEAIDARGTTNLSGGWLRGAEALGGQPDAPADREAAAANGSVRRVLLLTDGLANCGITDPDALAATAARLRAQGVTTSTFGVGADFDEQLLGRLATAGGGHFYFIEQPQQIPDLLASELGDTLEITARDVVLEIAGGEHFDIGLLNDLPVQEPPGRLRVPLGDLTAAQEVTLVVGVGLRVPAAEIGDVSVRCRLSDRDGRLPALPMTVEWRLADVGENEAQPVNADVLVAVAQLLAARARSLALAANRRHAFTEASSVLDDMADRIRRLLPGHAGIAAIAGSLEQGRVLFQEEMTPQMSKRVYADVRAVAYSRMEDGKARRRPRAPATS